MFTIIVRTEFDSAHFLRDYPGKCANLHGHTWYVEVKISSKSLNNLGFVVDFSEIKSLIKDLDHKVINSVDYFKEINPSAENIAKYLYNKIKDFLSLQDNEPEIISVKIKETPDNEVIYYEHL